MSVHQSHPHDSAPLHVTGAARYLDDIPMPAGTLHLAFGLSTVAHGDITAMDLSAVRAAPGVVAVLTGEEIGHVDCSPSPVPDATACCIPKKQNDLLVVSESCDAGCEVTFDKNGVVVQFKGVIVLQGLRDLPSHLWQVPLTTSRGISPPLAHNTNQYLSHNDYCVSNISKHLYNCEETPQLNWFYDATFFLLRRQLSLMSLKRDTSKGVPA